MPNQAALPTLIITPAAYAAGMMMCCMVNNDRTPGRRLTVHHC